MLDNDFIKMEKAGSAFKQISIDTQRKMSKESLKCLKVQE